MLRPPKMSANISRIIWKTSFGISPPASFALKGTPDRSKSPRTNFGHHNFS